MLAFPLQGCFSHWSHQLCQSSSIFHQFWWVLSLVPLWLELPCYPWSVPRRHHWWSHLSDCQGPIAIRPLGSIIRPLGSWGHTRWPRKRPTEVGVTMFNLLSLCELPWFALCIFIFTVFTIFSLFLPWFLTGTVSTQAMEPMDPEKFVRNAMPGECRHGEWSEASLYILVCLSTVVF